MKIFVVLLVLLSALTFGQTLASADDMGSGASADCDASMPLTSAPCDAAAHADAALCNMVPGCDSVRNLTSAMADVSAFANIHVRLFWRAGIGEAAAASAFLPVDFPPPRA